MDSAEHLMRHPTHCAFVGGVFSEKVNAQRGDHRGTTTKALNAGIDDLAIDTNIGWRKVEAKKGKMSRYSMRQRYIQVFQDLKHQLMFSYGI
jgi:hypothetical protein